MRFYKSGIIFTFLAAIAGTIALIIFVNSLFTLFSVLGAIFILLLLFFTLSNVNEAFLEGKKFSFWLFSFTLIIAFPTIIGFILLLYGYKLLKQEIKEINLRVKKIKEKEVEEILNEAKFSYHKKPRKIN